MKNLSKLLVILCAMVSLHAATMEHAQINWLTSYEEALKQSQLSKKPVLMLFTGSDFCYSCIKLKSEAIGTQEFALATFDKFVFLIVDFTKKTKMTPNLAAQATLLQKKYAIVSLPTVLLIDGTGKKIGALGYQAGGGKKYAEQLLLLNTQTLVSTK